MKNYYCKCQIKYTVSLDEVLPGSYLLLTSVPRPCLNSCFVTPVGREVRAVLLWYLFRPWGLEGI